MRVSKCLWIPAITGVIAFPNIGVSQENVGQEPLPLEAITVIGTTPIHGIGLEKKRIPASVQTADSEDLNRRNRSTLRSISVLTSTVSPSTKPSTIPSNQTFSIAVSPLLPYWACRRDFPSMLTASDSMNPSAIRLTGI